MEISERNYLISKINELSAKRQKHEKIIEKLLYNKQYSTDRSPTASRASDIRLADLGQKTKINNHNQEYVQNTARSNLSCLSNLSRQVNLDVHLAAKPEATPSSSSSSFCQNNLQDSLIKIYGDVKQSLIPNNEIAKKSKMVSQNSIDFQIISKYLHKNELWDQIFIKKQDGYYGCVCPQINPHLCQTINLSKQKITDKQLQLILKFSNNQQKSYYEDLQSQNQKSEDNKIIFIGYLLLYRLLSYLGTGFAPEIFQSMFGYPYKGYNIHKTEQYYQFTEKLKQMNEDSKVIVLGQNQLNRRIQQIQLVNLLELSLKQLLKKFNRIILISQIDNLCSKTLDVIHRRNHHSVIDFENLQDFQIQLFINFVINKPNDIKRQHKTASSYSSKCSISHTCCDKMISRNLFRYCLVNSAGQIVNYSSPFQNNKQNLSIKLAKKSQYKLYVSQISNNYQIQPDLSSFSIIIQSKRPLNNVCAQIKFNQSYNIMTQTLATKYLRDFVNLDEVQKQMARLDQINPDVDLRIVRAHLKFMGLVTDFISIKQQAIKKQRRLHIEYEDKQILCDKFYRQNRKRLNITLPQIQRIYLSKNSKIKSCSGFSSSFTQICL